MNSDRSAIHVVISNEYDHVDQKANPVDADRLLIEDSADSFAKKHVELGDIGIGNGGGGGPDAPYTLVLIPDTQHLSNSASWIAHFEAAADWIVANKNDRNIQAVLHLGDVVQNATNTEFNRATVPMDTIWDSGVPFAAAIGNHDYNSGTPNASHSNTSQWNTYFGTGKYTGRSWWNGEFKDAGQSENFYFTINLGGRPTLIFSLEFFPRSATMAWAEDVIEAHPLHDVIVHTHAYLFHDGNWTEDATPAGPNSYAITDFTSGGDMWRDHFRKYRNMAAVFSAHHIDGPLTAERTDPGDNGNLVFQQFTNWQEQGQGGDGRIVLLTINPTTGWATREVYNPRTDTFESAYDLTFQLFASGAEDPNAIHDNVAGEIQAITEKTTPVDADLLLIEDSQASYVKKKLQVGNLPGGGGVAGGALVTVDPGTVTSVIVSGDVEVTIESDYGIDSNGDPYFDDTGADAGEEAALCFRPSDHKFVLVGYQE